MLTPLHFFEILICHCACPPFEWRKERDFSLRSEQAAQSHRQRKISKKHDIASLSYAEIATLILLTGRIRSQ